MAGDKEIKTLISADASPFQDGMKKVSDAAKEAFDQVGKGAEALANPFDLVREHLAGLTALLAGGAAFKEAISATKEFVGEVTQLSKQAGISAQEASGLNLALGDIGSSADVYTSSLAKLTKQVRTNEAGLNAMGIATRDSNGQYLDGRALMDSAITTLNTYKEGTDRNLAAQVAFGKGAADSAALLKLSSGVQEEARKKAEDLNLVIGPGTQAAVKAYKMAMNDVADVAQGFEVTLGKAVMPVLTDLAQWFSSAGPAAIAVFKPIAAGIADTLRIVVDVVKDVWQAFATVFDDIGKLFNETSGQSLTFGEVVRNAFSIVGIALLAMKEAFQLAFEGIRAAINTVLGAVRTFANVADAAFHQDWSGAKAAWKAGLADIETEVSESSARILKIRTDAEASMEKLAMGEGYKRPGDGDSKTAAAPKGRSYQAESKGKDGATIVAQYEAELAAKKLQIDEENALNGTFYSMTKQAEADFWQAKVGTVEKGSKEYYQIEKKYVDARLALNKDAFDAELEGLKKQQDAIKYDFDAKLNFAQQELNLIRQKYGEKSKEYEKGEEEINKLKMAKADQQIKLQNLVAENERSALLAQVDLEEQHAQLEVALLLRTDAQLLADEQAFENRRYAIRLAAWEERKALADKEGNPVEIEKINSEKIQLETQYQQRLAAIKGKAVLQESQQSRAFFAILQSGFASVVSQAMQGTLKMRDVITQAYRSIADSLSQVVTKMVSDWLIGQAQKIVATKEANAVQIQSAAGEAAANAYNAIVGIPYVGPFLAPVAAAVAYAGVMAFAEQGYDVPAGVAPITQLHQREMVLPAKHADVIRGMADQGGAGGGGGGDTFNITALDAKSFHKMLMGAGPSIAASLQAQRRNFNAAA